MNVDVSPDGRADRVRPARRHLRDADRPAAGASPATRITSGPAFDMQPRFSPDGKRIAFSQRSRRPVEHLDDRRRREEREAGLAREALVRQQPDLVADGDYIFARRHFVAERSLGAGEIWMFHASGSDGLQVTEKNGFQKDAGEPAVSPDGRYLYYSKDVTPGQTFEYNKDPNGTIYAIIRRDLTTGRERRVVSVQGGSVTPRPSPDGKSLAYVRRVRLRASCSSAISRRGRDRAFFEHLDKDLQEAWAIHGLYPQYAWTPDGKVDRHLGRGKDLARRRRDRRRARDSVHRARRADGQRRGALPAEGLHAGVPGEDAARRRDLARRQARRLQRARPALCHGALAGAATPKRGHQRTTAFEFVPSWSATGSGSSTRRGPTRTTAACASSGPTAPAAATSSRTPGHYVEPSFSPDGKMDRLPPRRRRPDPRPVLRRRARHLRRADRRSAAPRLVREGGTEPSSITPARASTSATRATSKSVLLSVGVGDRRRRCRAATRSCTSSPRTPTQIVPSPDGKWVAFAERWHAYVAPFPHTGRPVDLGPTIEGYPVARISRDAGFYLHWSGDSRRSTGRSGPELFTRDLDAHVHVPRQRPREARRARGQGRPHRLHREERRAGRRRSRSSARGSSRWRRPARSGRRRDRERHGRRRGQPHHRGRAVIVGQCAGAARSASTSQARRSCRASSTCTGTSAAKGTASSRRSSWPLAANLAFGVTTSHDPSNDTETVFTNAELIRAGREARAAAVLDRHDPLRRRDAVQGGRSRTTTMRCRTAAAEGGGRVPRQELQPAAPRRAADDHQGRARAADEVVPEGGLAALHERDDDPRRPHRASSTRCRCRSSTRTSSRCSRRARPATRRR